MPNEAITYDKAQLRGIIKAFGAMDDQAVAESKKQSSALVEYLQRKIIGASSFTQNLIDDRIAAGSRVSKSSKIGEISFGFASQKFSGGGNLDQTNTSNSRIGQANLAGVHAVGLFIRHYAKSSHTLLINGKMPLIA